jgi:hypothetical protein
VSGAEIMIDILISRRPENMRTKRTMRTKGLPGGRSGRRVDFL